MTEYKVIDVDSSQDLQAFSQYLWQQGIAHRILQQQQRQYLLVGEAEQARFVASAYRQWLQGLTLPQWHPQQAATPAAGWREWLAKAPVTYSFILLSILGFLIVSFDRQLDWVRWLSFYDYQPFPRFLQVTVPEGQWWRLLTPIFLHFGWLHISFNMLWLYELGRRIERVQGSLTMVGLVMALGLAGNIAQSWYTKVGVFGGMSGVIYGLLGYSWIWSVLRADSRLAVPRPVLYFMLGSLLVFMMGFSEWLGVGKVANAAHLGGLIMGMLMGALTALLDTLFHQRRGD